MPRDRRQTHPASQYTHQLGAATEARQPLDGLGSVQFAPPAKGSAKSARWSLLPGKDRMADAISRCDAEPFCGSARDFEHGPHRAARGDNSIG